MRYRKVVQYPLNGAGPCPHIEEYRAGKVITLKKNQMFVNVHDKDQ